MIDINIYRCRIGLFCPKSSNKKFVYRRQYYRQFSWNESQAGRNLLLTIQSIVKFVLLLSLLLNTSSESFQVSSSHGHVSGLGIPVSSSKCEDMMTVYSGVLGGHECVGRVVCAVGTVVWVGRGELDIQEEKYSIHSEIVDHNFLARYQHGNITQKKKGILNMHLNIRSLRYKVHEVKQVVKEHKPFILGISECELKKDKVDETCLKVPGYDILFPKSWKQHGFARVVVYVKKTFKYQ